MTTDVTGYGPRQAKRIYFDGDEERYEMWEIKFLSHLRLRKLTLEDHDEGDDFAERNADVFAELVQVLDDKSLQLIMRDAVDDGRKALKILRDQEKPRIISLYTELTFLKMNEGESLTDYILRAESAATSLKSAGETISDSLLTAMLLKGLPEQFTAFSTVIMQKEQEPTFLEFKSLLRSYEESQKCRATHTGNSDNVLKVKLGLKETPEGKGRYSNSSPVTCYTCRKPGHKSYECTLKKANGKWCKECRSTTHNFNECREIQ